MVERNTLDVDVLGSNPRWLAAQSFHVQHLLNLGAAARLTKQVRYAMGISRSPFLPGCSTYVVLALIVACALVAYL